MRRLIFQFTTWILFFTFIYAPLFAVEVKLDVDKSIMYLTGERIHLTFTVKHDPDEKLIYKDSDIQLDSELFCYKTIFISKHPNEKLEIESFKPIVHTIKEDTQNGKKVIWDIFKCEIQLFEVEDLQVNPVKFLFLKGKTSFIVYSPYTFIHTIPPEPVIPKQIEISQFENEILKRLSDEKSNILIDFYSKNEEHYSLRECLTQQEKSEIDSLLQLAGYEYNRFPFKKISEPGLNECHRFLKSELIALGEGFFILIFIVLIITRIRRQNWIRKDQLTTPLTQAHSTFQVLRDNVNQGELNHFRLNILYSDMSINIKQFIERKLLYFIMEMSSKEILNFLASHLSDQKIIIKLKTFLSLCDEVKFAGKIRGKTEIENDLLLGEEIISQLHDLMREKK